MIFFSCKTIICNKQAVGDTWYKKNTPFEKFNLTICFIRNKEKRPDFPYQYHVRASSFNFIEIHLKRSFQLNSPIATASQINQRLSFIVWHLVVQFHEDISPCRSGC